MNCLILDIVFISMGSLSQYEYAEKIGDLVNIVDKALGSTMPLSAGFYGTVFAGV